MKKIKHLRGSEKAKEVDQTNSKSYFQGVTQRLLDKYKPSMNFVVIHGKHIKFKEPKAA